MSNPGIGHRCIAASAGSGKTFQLTNRYIGLLLTGTPPPRIVALTFSRKAAGEILDKILGRLAAAASDRKTAHELAQALHSAGYLRDPQGIDQARVRQVLRSLLDQLHVARIGTLDSFFVSIIRNFPFEFGLSGAMEIMDDHSARLAVAEVLDHVLDHTHSLEQRADFVEQFKRATFGQEGRSFSQRLHDFVAQYHRFYLDAPSAGLWGDPLQIWPHGPAWHVLEPEQLEAESLRLSQQARDAGLTPARLQRFERLTAEIAQFNPGLKPEGQVAFFLNKFADYLGHMATHGCSVTLGSKKPVELPASLCQPLDRLLSHVIGSALSLHLTRTNGIGNLLAAFETTYQAQIRSAGKLTFQDIQYLLGQGGVADTPVLSGQRESDRLYIDYRLDGAFDHWLLDEFQDTSTVQWQALANLADEVLSCRDGTRSLFYVGDVKQAIYAWRYGDHSLFGRILDHYNDEETPRIEVQQLATSYRSSPTVIDTVNRLFGDLSGSGLSQAIQDEWYQGWQEHHAHHLDLPGCAEFYEVEKGREMTQEAHQICRINLAIAHLKKVEPWQRGLTSAILVRSGKFGKQVVSQLRQAAIPVVWEGDFGLLDSPAVQTTLAILQAAAHPGDTYARRQVEMVPAASVFRSRDGQFSIATEDILRRLARTGFEGTCHDVAARLQNAGLLSHGDTRRMEQLAVAAALFDRTGQRRVLDFIDFISAYRIAEEGMPEAVRVMTIHKSKGLEFDLVILPELEGKQGMETVNQSGMHLCRDDTLARTPQWALLLPSRTVAQADSTLAGELDRLALQNGYEALCLLYVAVTRAARALLMIGSQAPAASNTIHHSTLVRSALASSEPVSVVNLPGLGQDPVQALCLYRSGDPNWFSSMAASEQQAIPESESRDAIPLRQGRRPRKTPSGEEAQTVLASSLFAPTSLAALELGTAVHALFEEIEWSESTQLDSAIKAAKQRVFCPPNVWGQALEQLRTSLASADVLSILSMPPQKTLLWREKEFEALVDEHWVSGCFDRVHLYHAPDETISSAAIIDYKTTNLTPPGALEEAIAHYHPQMSLYQKVLAQLTGLDATKITLTLIFTRHGRIARL